VDRSTLTDRLSDAGAVHPLPSDDGSRRFSLDDVTVVTPQLDGVVHDDGRLTVDDGSVPPIEGAGVRLEVNRGPAAARNAARPMIARRWWRSSTPTSRHPIGSGCNACCGTSTIHGSGWSLPVCSANRAPRSTWVTNRLASAPDTCELRAGRCARGAHRGTRLGRRIRRAVAVRRGRRPRVAPRRRRMALPLRPHDDGLARTAWLVAHTAAPARGVRNLGCAAGDAAPSERCRPSTSTAGPQRPGRWRCSGAGSPQSWSQGAAPAALVGKLPDVPARASLGLALRGHLLAGRQFAAAARRVWWPILVVVALVSRRARWWAALAVLSDVRATPTDLAYGWGVWVGMLRLRTPAPLLPRLSAWPGRQSRHR
jgi:mycofactocin glycosyltransferase